MIFSIKLSCDATQPGVDVFISGDQLKHTNMMIILIITNFHVT